jgi:O-succinylbenzoate synthase
MLCPAVLSFGPFTSLSVHSSLSLSPLVFLSAWLAPMHVTGAATAVQFQLLLVVQLPFHPFLACLVLAVSS